MHAASPSSSTRAEDELAEDDVRRIFAEVLRRGADPDKLKQAFGDGHACEAVDTGDEDSARSDSGHGGKLGVW